MLHCSRTVYPERRETGLIPLLQPVSRGRLRSALSCQIYFTIFVIKLSYRRQEHTPSYHIVWFALTCQILLLTCTRVFTYTPDGGGGRFTLPSSQFLLFHLLLLLFFTSSRLAGRGVRQIRTIGTDRAAAARRFRTDRRAS